MAKPEIRFWVIGKKGDPGYFEGHSIHIAAEGDCRAIDLSVRRCESILKNLLHIKKFVKAYECLQKKK